MQQAVLKGQKPLTKRPGEYLEPVDFDALKEELQQKQQHKVTEEDVISYALYPKVYEQYIQTFEKFGDVSILDTPTFFFGMRDNETVEIEIDKGKILIITLKTITKPDENGMCTVFFDMNGQARRVRIKDENVQSSKRAKPKADKSNPTHIGAQMPGTVLQVDVSEGDEVEANQSLIITEAMKMETTVQAPFKGIVKKISCISE